ncbi:MAG: DUF11 domain-containing protein [Burkholderiales bacterium]|nr:DUF11 domain-containing protein [Burkholderiales bacterium]
MFASLLRAGLALLAALALLYPWSTVYALGTAAGTTINNNATATYSIGGVPAPPVSSGVSIRVDELINVRVTAPVSATAVNTPDSNKVLVFTVTNIGNGPESFNLTPNLSVGGDQFNPTPGTAGQLFLDVNNNGVLDGGDTLISASLALAANQSASILLVSNIPSSRINGDQGVVTLAVAATTAGAAGATPGTVLIGLGTPAVGVGSVDAVIGAGPGGPADSGADDSVNGTYVVANVTVTVSKVIIAVTSPFGVTTTGCNAGVPPVACTALVPGTIIQYEVTVTIAGTGTAQGVQVTDNVPANTTYVGNSIRFNTATRTDAVDPDNASCAGCGNAVGTVTVLIGDVTVAGAPITHVIDYKFTIN